MYVPSSDALVMNVSHFR